MSQTTEILNDILKTDVFCYTETVEDQVEKLMYPEKQKGPKVVLSPEVEDILSVNTPKS